MSKGSGRRPGTLKPGAWEAIFNKPKCPKCGEEPCSCCPTDDGPADGDDNGNKEE